MTISIEFLTNLIQHIYEKYKHDYVDSCYHASKDIIQILIENNISGFLVCGNIYFNETNIQHYWIVVENIVIDVTSQQFDFNKFIFTSNDVEFDFYQNEFFDYLDF